MRGRGHGNGGELRAKLARRDAGVRGVGVEQARQLAAPGGRLGKPCGGRFGRSGSAPHRPTGERDARPFHAERPGVGVAVRGVVQHRKHMVEQVLDAQAQGRQVLMRHLREVGPPHAHRPRRAVVPDFDGAVAQIGREPARSAFDGVGGGDVVREAGLRFGFVAPQMLGRRQPQVPLEHMGPIIGARPVEEPTIRLPIEPPIVERPVREAHEARLARAATRQQRITHRAGFEVRRRPHRRGVTPGNFLVAQGRVEVVRDSRLQPVEVRIDEKSVAAGPHSGKRHRKQFRQRRPVEPFLAHGHGLEWQTEAQRRRQRGIAGIHARGAKALEQRRPTVDGSRLVEVSIPDAPCRPRPRFARLAEQGDAGAHPDAGRLALQGEHRLAGAAIRRVFGDDAVAMQVVDAHRVECLQVTLPHPREGQPVQPRIVGDEADHALPGLLHDAPFRHAEETDVEVVQPLALRPAHLAGGAVGIRQCPFLIHRHAGETVVRRVAEDDEDRGVLLHPRGAVAFFREFREGQPLGRAGLPAGERVGEEDAGALGAIVRQWRVEALQREAHLQVRDDERRRHDLKAEHALEGRLLHPCTSQGAQAGALQVGGDAAQHFGQIRAGAAARVQHVNVVRRQPGRDAQVLLQRQIDPRHHVAHHLGRRVPHAQLLAQIRVEGFQEGFVEVGHRLAFVKAGEEGAAVHPLKGRRRPIQHLHQAQRLQPPGIRELLEQRPQHRRPQMPNRLPPAEGAAGRRGLTAPEHPSGEDAVEERLHQRGLKEAQAAFALEVQPQRLLQCAAQRLKRFGIVTGLHPAEPIAGIGGEQVGQILRFHDLGPVGERPSEVFAQTGPHLAGQGFGSAQPQVEVLCACRQAEGLQLNARFRHRPDQRELSQIGY